VIPNSLPGVDLKESLQNIEVDPQLCSLHEDEEEVVEDEEEEEEEEE
jgi:hypothetical protein